MLEDALDEYEGTVLLVSHDRAFLREVATRMHRRAQYSESDSRRLREAIAKACKVAGIEGPPGATALLAERYVVRLADEMVVLRAELHTALDQRDEADDLIAELRKEAKTLLRERDHAQRVVVEAHRIAPTRISAGLAEGCDVAWLVDSVFAEAEAEASRAAPAGGG